MSVGPGGHIGTSKSLGETFSGKIGSQGGQSRSLYKIPLLFEGVNFSTCDDDMTRSAGIKVIPDIREGTDVETDFISSIGTDCEVAPEPLVISEGSRGPAKELGSFFSLSWVKGPSS